MYIYISNLYDSVYLGGDKSTSSIFKCIGLSEMGQKRKIPIGMVSKIRKLQFKSNFEREYEYKFD